MSDLRDFQFEMSSRGAGKTRSVDIRATGLLEAVRLAEEENGGWSVSRGSSVYPAPDRRAITDVFPNKFVGNEA